MLIVLVCLLLASCANEWDALSDRVESKPYLLSVSVRNNPRSKSRVDGVYMPDDAEMGVFLRASDGSLYNGNSIDNVRYKASGAGDSQSWQHDPETPIELLGIRGSAYAYYPRQEGDVSLSHILMKNDGTDWMFSVRPVTNLSNKNNHAQFNMAHAMTIIRCKLVKGLHDGSGVVQTLSLRGASLASSAALNLETSTFSDFSEFRENSSLSDIGVLSAEPIEVEFWAIPKGMESELSFQLVVDGFAYLVKTPSFTPVSGTINHFTFTVNSKSVDLSQVQVTDWNEMAEVPLESDHDPETQYLTWEKAKQTDGVYAIDNAGRPVPFDEAIDERFTGAAFVINGKAYKVADNDIPGTVYWWQSGYEDIDELNNYTYSYETKTYAYVPKADGSYAGSSNRINTDWSTWVNAGWQNASFTDFDGKGNTEILIARLGTIENTIGKAVVDFRTNHYLNEGYQDWFVPSCAQMACMAILCAKIESVLSKVPGAAIFDHSNRTDYWTSTEKSASDAWYVGFFDGGVGTGPKNNNRPKRCRLVREL